MRKDFISWMDPQRLYLCKASFHYLEYVCIIKITLWPSLRALRSQDRPNQRPLKKRGLAPFPSSLLKGMFDAHSATLSESRRPLCMCHNCQSLFPHFTEFYVYFLRIFSSSFQKHLLCLLFTLSNRSLPH